MHPCFQQSNRQLCSFIPRQKKRSSKTKQLARAQEKEEIHRPQPQLQSQGQHQALSHQSQSFLGACGVSGPSSLTSFARSPHSQQKVGSFSKHSMSSNNDSSSWVQNHDQWLMDYVQFLVNGEDSGSKQKGVVNGSFLPQPQTTQNVSLADVCDEIVLTFKKQDDDLQALLNNM